jgi:hypothetical protein
MPLRQRQEIQELLHEDVTGRPRISLRLACQAVAAIGILGIGVGIYDRNHQFLAIAGAILVAANLIVWALQDKNLA